MNTTNLFVELVVIGFGAFAWVGLLGFAALGYPIPDLSVFNELSRAVPAMAIVYLLGIVSDRMADWLFQFFRMDTKRKRDYPGGTSQFFQDRVFVLAQSPEFARQYDYSRSRQRICRGWTLNGLGLLLAFNVYSIVRHTPESWGARLVISALLVMISIFCWLSWESMSNAELKRIREQADGLRRMGPHGGKT